MRSDFFLISLEAASAVIKEFPKAASTPIYSFPKAAENLMMNCAKNRPQRRS